MKVICSEMLDWSLAQCRVECGDKRARFGPKTFGPIEHPRRFLTGLHEHLLEGTLYSNHQ